MDDDDSSAERLSVPRVSQACQRCRSLKTRCLPSETASTCQRCLASKRECVWANTPRRPRRVRGPSRIAQVEQKIDGLFASIVNSDSARYPITSAPEQLPHRNESLGPVPAQNQRVFPGNWLPFPGSFEQREDAVEKESEVSQHDAEPTHQFIEELHKIHSFGDTELGRPPRGIFQGSQKSESPIDNEQLKSLLSTGEADTLLNEYRSMCISFPFVPLRSTTSAHELHATKPILFLAVITVASWKDHKRQMQLDQVYRTELANRIIIHPRKTVSLLQSILVYLSRYHFVFSHRTQQVYTLQQLAVGLALDIGLHQSTKRSIIDVSGRPPPQYVSVEEQLERQRTFLGCYNLSSMVAGGLQKPNLLKHTDYMVECGRNLQQNGEYAADAVLSRIIAQRRLDDQIHDSFCTESTIDLPLTDPRITMNYRFMQAQLSEHRKEDYGQDLKHIYNLSISFTDVQLHCIALRKEPATTAAPILDSARFNALLETLEACKHYFDALLAVPASEYHLISFPEWMRLPFVVVTLSRLCIPGDLHTAMQWDAKAAHERGRLDLYLESLCHRMQGLSTSHFDFWYILRMIMELMRGWYVRKVNAKGTSSQGASIGLPTPDTTGALNQNAIHPSSLITSTHGQQMCPHATPASEALTPDEDDSGCDPFAFMRDADFDMDKFFDMGLWGDESYNAMGFDGSTNL